MGANVKSMARNNKAGKILAALIVLAAVAVNRLPEAQATEGGGGAYPNGAQGFLAGALPPPGFYFIEYLQHYSADALMDGNGRKLPVPFKLNVSAAVNRFLYQSEVPLLGGHLGAHVILPLLHASADTGLGSGSKSGLGDITTGPYIAWHFGKNLHMAAGIDITLPTGSYEKTELVNLGRNYWTFEPIFGVTYLTDGGMEFSGKFMYDINTENSDTDYKSGQEFHFDYAVGYHTGPWTLGAAGYYYKQITGDSGAGAVLGDYEGQVIAIGPAVRYDAKNGVSVEFRYNKEFEAENRTEGDKFWVNVVCKF